MARILTHIDGSILEGGGQILRNSISLSALLERPITIKGIRNNRKPPGLKNQHRTGLELASRISASSLLTGAVNGSSEITFNPGKIVLPGSFEADAVTAGSTTLLLQVALPVLLFSNKKEPSTLTLKGGTNATMAPQIDYTQHVLLPILRSQFGIEESNKITVQRRGYFPKGGGIVSVDIFPTIGKIKPIHLMDRGRVTSIGGTAHLAGLPAVVGQGMVQGAMNYLSQAGYPSQDAITHPESIPVDISYTREDNKNSTGAGSGIVLWAELSGGGRLGGSAVGSKGKDPSEVGREAAEELVKAIHNEGCVDEWLQDQIVIFMALADGLSSVNCGRDELTLHTQTAIHIASQLTSAKFEVTKDENGCNIIQCHGIGFQQRSEEIP